jgi:hypothetical protein
VTPVVSAVFDTPQATAPPFDGMFIHPPFNNLPEGVVLTAEGMNYSVMHQHPTWFLDIKDYITLDANPDGAVRYPRDLEPPRPRRQKDLLLRCTFCPRTYAGVNAKSMWTRHVREKHRVVLSKAWSDTATSSRRQSTGTLRDPCFSVPSNSLWQGKLRRLPLGIPCRPTQPHLPSRRHQHRHQLQVSPMT